ncbi:hypothetical protein G7B40_020045 [Aetokthonos hydrillicola Thurmond2011]|jgi:hypothetical protein|uniref:Uncharacterized protein n=1 Tax=Aetokthonos hydrillicola Thurmond2011 TaxID=2712845 RepID=A0AAP5MBG7_9CYAN|nr:hypothetical protein [Aetokthonos hydrillicola]MBO3460414.1 hypothetical protein [Aetokthonos hydrillicola CCALA 1050]MBW4588510.1 hypothetical protein [Aetokthonos hydrillicola CCALA 1050]MDR9896839.1 hypothetical protein [Aetokthonos hydrillicola Thurmond2011]
MGKILQLLLIVLAFTIGSSGFAIKATPLNLVQQNVAIETLRVRDCMTSQLHGMMAAPNQSEIKAKVLHIQQSDQFSDKWYLELKILESKNITGGTFAQIGDQVKAFTIAQSPHFGANSIISAQAEFVGDPHGGFFRLNNIQIVKSQN